MTQITVDVDPAIDKKIGIMKIELEFTTKAQVVEKIIDAFFDNNMKLNKIRFKPE